jgi:acetyltransferase-like isoleucine patch superfamily enzyme
LGQVVKIYAIVNLYGCEIGDESKIGTLVEILKDIKIGKRVKVSSHTFICEGVTIEDEVFVGHSVTFVNDRFPHAPNEDGSIQTDVNWTLERTLVKRRTSIGSGSTILSGVCIGENAIVGTGSVVTHDVPDESVIARNPA